MKREELMEKALTADYQSLKELGWLEVFEALKGWWPKRMSVEDLAPYMDVLHEETADHVMETLRGLRGEQWRPSPSSLYREIQGIASQKQAAKDSARDRIGRKKRADQSASALLRVRMMVESGQQVCECNPRPTNIREDRYHVLYCTLCGLIEQGQAFDAEDDGTEF